MSRALRMRSRQNSGRSVGGVGEQCGRGVLFLVPLFVALGSAQPESAAEIDDNGSGVQKLRRQVHGNFGGGGEQNRFEALVCNGFRDARERAGWWIYGAVWRRRPSRRDVRAGRVRSADGRSEYATASAPL